MLRLTKVIIENYKSIGYLEYDVLPGVYRAIAEVVNGEYKSNGGGKSTALQAVFLGLYNVDFQGAPIDSLSNRLTKKLFKISVDFEVRYEDSIIYYTVINDRTQKRHLLYKNGKLISKAYKETAKHIVEIFGMSSQTFKFTHYITTNTILELTANLSNITLFNEILQVAQLKMIRQQVKDFKNKLTKRMNEIQSSINIAKQQKRLQEILHDSSITEIEHQLEEIDANLSILQEKEAKLLLPLQQTLKELQTTISDKEKTMRDKQEVIDNGVCPVCKTKLIDDSDYRTVLQEIKEINETIKLLKSQKQFSIQQVESIKSDIEKERVPIEAQKLTYLQQKEAYFTLQKAFIDIKKADVSTDIIKEYDELKQAIAFFSEVETAIRNGEVFEAIMKDFFTIVNINIQKYRKLINFSQFEVEAIPDKSGMRVQLSTDGVPIVIESLSNGEKARLSLLILSALLESMHEVSGTHTNFIVFDEATSSFDEAGLADLKRLFRHLVSIGQSCFIISHGTELSSVELNGELKLVKTAGVTSGMLEFF